MEGQAKLGLFSCDGREIDFFDSSKGRQQICGFMCLLL